MKTLLTLLLLIPFFSYSNENVITKIEIDDFWKQLKEIRETKYGIDEVLEKILIIVVIGQRESHYQKMSGLLCRIY